MSPRYRTPRHAPLLLLALAALLLTGCVKTAPELTDLGALKDGELALVGRIELVPPLREGEQHIVPGGTAKEEDVRNKVHFAIKDEYADYTGEQDGDFLMAMLGMHIATAEFDETVYATASYRPLHINSIFFYLKFDAPDATYEVLRLPAGLRIDVQPGDRAVYFGTIRFHRNDFFDITDAEIVDEFEQERRAFRERFGDAHPLARRIAVPVEPPGENGG